MAGHVTNGGLGDLIAEFRSRAGLTQAELAAKASLSVRALRDMERGRVAVPRPESVHRLADALQLSPAERGLITSLVSGAQEPAAGLAIGVLGPLTVSRKGVPVPVSSQSLRLLLGALALESDRAVPAELLAELLWGATPPHSWRNRIHVHIGALRNLLEPGRAPAGRSRLLVREAGGYRLQLRGTALDVTRFQTLAQAAEATHRHGDAAPARRLYEQAVACWRGPILDGLDGELSALPSFRALQRARISATLALADLALPAGEASRAVLWLAELARQEPLNEAVHARYLAALAACGQRDRAVAVYHDLRTRLSVELGIHPGQELQQRYRAVLDTRVDVERPATSRVPAQLPVPPLVFAGRDDTAELLVGHLRRAPAPTEIAAPKIVLIHGLPGVGKTALALRVAHALRATYPDGQLYADLRGESDRPADPATVLAHFLRALGVAPTELPPSAQERAAMVRTCLSHRQVLVLLDDASTARQVLPLLPATPGNDVIITSRSTLIELPITRVPLAPLTLDGSLAVLSTYLSEGVPADPEAAVRIAASCGGLPLALQIAAGRTAHGESLSNVAESLHVSSERLDGLQVGQLGLSATLSSAYDNLSARGRTILRRLALLPTRTIPGWAAHIATGATPAEGERMLAELTDAHLVTPTGTGVPRSHYRMHDLIRLHSASLATGDDGAARDDVLGYLLHLAETAAARQVSRRLTLQGLGVSTPAQPPVEIVDADTWITTERDNILDALAYCAENGSTRMAAGFLNAISYSLRSRHLLDEAHHFVELVLRVTADGADPLGHAYASEALVWLHIMANTEADAVPVAELALETFTALGDHRGRAMTQYHLQYLTRRRDLTSDRSITMLDAIIADYPLHQSRSLVAGAHYALGVIYREDKLDLDASIHHIEQALRFNPDPTTRERRQFLYSLARAYVQQERHREAEPLLVEALQLARAANDLSGTIAILTKLSDVWDPHRAARALDEAHEIAQQTDRPTYRGDVVRARSRLAERTGDIPGSIAALEEAAHLYHLSQSAQAMEITRGELARLQAKLRDLTAGRPSC